MRIRIAAPAHNCQAAPAALVLTLLFVGASFSWPVHAQEEQGWLKPAPTQTPWRTAPARVTPTHYKIDVAFEPERHFLRAIAAITLRLDEPCDPRRGGPAPALSAAEGCPPDSTNAQAIEFELNRHLTLRSVTDQQGRALEFLRSPRFTSHKLLVRLAEPAPAQSTLTLIFTYDGALPPAPLDYITPDGILLRDESRWYPATDLAAFATQEIRISLPASLKAIASCQMLGEESVNTNAVSQWQSSVPTSSRALAAYPRPLGQVGGGGFGRHFEVEESLGLPIRGEPPPWRVGHLGGAANSIVSQFLYSIGSLPRKRLTVFRGFPGQQGVIGYSAPGFLVVSEDVAKWHGHPGFAPEFLPHEIAHQWFPIEVTLRSEEDGWLAESLAEYLAWRYLEEKQPDDARRMIERAMRSTLALSRSFGTLRPLSLGLKLFALESFDVTHATLYQRGMLVWRTLETVIDRERVDRALREYYARHRGGPASIADFRRICEEISGRDLAWFFDYYINGVELPTITLRRLPSAAPNELAGEIVVSNAPPDFQVRVEMRITTRDGAIDHSVATRGEVTPFAINVPAPVASVTLDPRLRILRVTEPARRHRAQLAALEQAGIAEQADFDQQSLQKLVTLFESAIALDPGNLAANHQLYYLQIGRLQFRLEQYDAAWKSLDRALALESLDPMATDFHRAWARVYRARIALTRGDRAAARRETDAGLALNSPVLDSPVAWPEAPEKRTTAAEALRALLAKL